MKKRILLIASILVLLLSSCTNYIDAPDNSWEEIFQRFWNDMNTEYVHFSEDRTCDWDSIYEEYIPKFRSLDYTKFADSIEAFRYFKEIVVKVHDNHYNLTIKDGLGNTLSTSPALLNKYKAAGGDIMDFPDITVPGDFGNKTVSVNKPEDNVDTDEIRKIYQSAIPSIFEVNNLLAGKDITIVKKEDESNNEEQKKEEVKEADKYGYFHNSDGDIQKEFPEWAYYGYTFKEFSDVYIKTLGRDCAFYALEWNLICKAISLESFFYGVNKDCDFYIYFSSFGNPLFLSDILTKETLTESEKKSVESNETLKKYRGYVRDLIHDYETGVDEKGEDAMKSDAAFREEIGERIDALYHLQDMYANLKSAVTSNECTINKTPKNGINGIIVDLRGNGGGYVSFLQSIWGLFFKEKTQFGYIRYKSGYSRLEYTPWVSFNIESAYANDDLKETYKNPVAVLVNGYSVSCSEISCIIARLLPNSKIIGHTTFGGTCALSDRTIFNGGPFSSEHINIYTSTFQFVDTQYNSYETTGIKPDIETALDPTKDYAYIQAVKWVNGN